MRLVSALLLSLTILTRMPPASAAGAVEQPVALVYRGPAACAGCPEAVAHLLRTSASNFKVTYVGPHEDVDVTRESLEGAAVYAQPGGPDLARSMREDLGRYNATLRHWLHHGGRFLGFCLGAYTAGYDPGFALLPPGMDTNEECTRPGAQVTTRKNSMLQVNWHFRSRQSGKQGTVDKGRWIFFQDGAVILPKDIEAKARRDGVEGLEVLARYTSNDDVAAIVAPFGKGWIGITGPHPEARKGWFSAYGLVNPDGIHFDMGHDLVETVMSK